MAADRVFELRTYVAAPGRMEALKARFADHTVDLFARHGLELIAFLTPTDPPTNADPAAPAGAGTAGSLTYLLAFPDRAAAEQRWAEFRADPDWIAAKAASEVDGPLVDRIDSTYLAPTGFSPLR